MLHVFNARVNDVFNIAEAHERDVYKRQGVFYVHLIAVITLVCVIVCLPNVCLLYTSRCV